ncbi:MAG: ribose-5-phosphate isomerase RpiA [Pseudomonadota bacterium]
MSNPLTPAEVAKLGAARRALDMVEDGMRVGLGTGSTAVWFVRLLGERVRRTGLDVLGVPTSVRTGDLAERVGIRLTTLDEVGWLDLTVDGADEVDPQLNLIKGGGGALLQEKIVATASDEMVVICDDSKMAEHLGAFPLPLEIVPFGWETTKAIVEDTLESAEVGGTSTTLRLNRDEPFVTDEGHFILDLYLHRIAEAQKLSILLNQIPGVVENGLFIDVADRVVVGYSSGEVIVRDLDGRETVTTFESDEVERNLFV